MSEMGQPVNSWRGHPRYACPLCAWDTLDAAAFRHHVAAVHVTHTVRAPRPAVAMTVERRPSVKKREKE